ncbi:uncharacterized protein AB675_8288 [Cyphellophora attinorum]|uniref:Uncharacterized protein n=1 Tax=Cyphellophora attinorum TaxID=1664694 RepID=A0A0N1HW93_9EURO|nr:uncharacterized protein AB675_8288 [Phialophora attinorum]KPI44372.1 hypothetical protein AB675_8288 [Phialophora attinorum]
MHCNPSYSCDDEKWSITDEIEPDGCKRSLPFIDLYPHMYSKLSRPPLQSSQTLKWVDGPGEKDCGHPWSPQTLSARHQATDWYYGGHVSTSSLIDVHHHEPGNNVFSPSPDEAPFKTRLKTLFTAHGSPKHSHTPPKHTFRTRDPTTNEWHSYPSILTTTSASSDADLFDPVAVKHSLAARKRGRRRCHAPIPLGVVLLVVLCSPGILAYGWAEGRWGRWKRESGSHKRKGVTEEEDEAKTGEKAEY